MSTSEWIAIGGIASTLFVTIIGSTAMLSFKIGVVIEKIGSLDQRVTLLEKTVAGIQETLANLKFAIGQMQVKVDVLL